MLSNERVAHLLALQERAYNLLKWLADEVSWRPHLLLPQEAALLHKPEAARQWLDKFENVIPERLVPEPSDDDFVNIFSSFFSTSFRIGHFEFDGKLIESKVKLRTDHSYASLNSPSADQCAFLALKHLCNSEKLYLTDKEMKMLTRRKSLQEPLFVWTYVWELDRRAKGKGKGAVVHQIWRNIPRPTRESLSAEKVSNNKEQLLSAVSHLIAEQTG